MVKYPAVIHKDPDSAYGVSFPDFPGCISAGDTPEEALSMAEEALQLHVDGMVEDGEEIAAPSAIETTYADLAGEHAVVALVPVRLPAPTKRVNISMDSALLEAIDDAARQNGLTRSGFLAEGARRLLHK